MSDHLSKQPRASHSQITATAVTPSPGKHTLTEYVSPAEAPSTGERAVIQRRAAGVAALAPAGDRSQQVFGHPIQRKTDGGPDAAGGGMEPADDTTALAGGGRPLPDAVRHKMEHALGADFAAVRIHEGRHAAAMGAVAYTRGSDIHFAPGKYDPESQAGQELLGHELVHVVQQSRGRVAATTQSKSVGLNDSSALEHEADELGAKAAAAPAPEPAAPGRAACSPEARCSRVSRARPRRCSVKP
jgi:hypothetical protein